MATTFPLLNEAAAGIVAVVGCCQEQERRNHAEHEEHPELSRVGAEVSID
jgi:hypothetical protein